MPLSVADYEAMRFRRNSECRRICGRVTSTRVHQWCDEEGSVSTEEAEQKLHEVATVMSAGTNAHHEVFRLNSNGSVTHKQSMWAAQGFVPFDRRRWNALACRCCQHDLIVVAPPPGWSRKDLMAGG